MHRRNILEYLEGHAPSCFEEIETVRRFRQFVEETPTCFERTHKAGHVTGSAFILSSDKKRVLLAHHAKLQSWLQLGGHADGCSDVLDVAHREAVEESGLSEILPCLTPQIPIDFDTHEIPANKKDEAHLHFDVRFVFYSLEEKFICSNESLALKWVPLEQVPHLTSEPSVLRVIRKIQLA